jgi:lipopolysaccharide assembly outer membrane protein LptD (OstA)
MKFNSPNLVVLLAVAACACQAQQNLPELFGTGSNAAFNTEGETNFATGGVLASNENYTVTAEQFIENDVTGEIAAEGDIIILDHGHIWRGTNAVYNFKTGDVRAAAFKSAQMPFNISGEHLTGDSNHVFTATNALITTDDYAKPIYKIRARTLTIAPGKYIEAHQATFYLGKTPVFYLPYYRHTLGKHPDNFEFVPGWRSTYGPFLLGAYNWYGNGLLDGTIHLDEREKRGLAGGPDFLLHLGDYGQAAFRYYYAHDLEPNADGLNLPDVKSARQRMSFYYQDAPSTNFTAKVIANYQSDPIVIRDFYESEYRANIEPASFAETEQLWPNFTLNAMAQPRLVNFFETVERLPDLKLTGLRQEVGVTPIYYESESSVGYFRKDFSDTNSPTQTNYSGMRADTVQQFVLPETFFGWLNVTPRVGGRLTYYGAVEGVASPTNAQTRGVFDTGVDFSFKASRVYRDVESSFWDLQDLRHIIEPDINYAYVPAPSRSPEQLPQYDTAMPALRLLPLEAPDYNSIDSIDKQNVLRLTLRNKLQTKRRDNVEDVINWAVYTDWNLTPGTNHIFSDLYSDLTLRPRTWLTLNSSVRYDLPDHRWRDAINSISVVPNSTWSVSLGYRYLMNNDPEFLTAPGQTLPGHNLFSASLYYRMNENWSMHIIDRYEAQSGTLQEQDYTLVRDLRSWTAALIFRLTEGVGQPEDFTVGVSFSLKAFPRFPLGSDSDQPKSMIRSTSVVDSLGIY